MFSHFFFKKIGHFCVICPQGVVRQRPHWHQLWQVRGHSRGGDRSWCSAQRGGCEWGTKPHTQILWTLRCSYRKSWVAILMWHSCWPGHTVGSMLSDINFDQIEELGEFFCQSDCSCRFKSTLYIRQKHAGHSNFVQTSCGFIRASKIVVTHTIMFVVFQFSDLNLCEIIQNTIKVRLPSMTRISIGTFLWMNPKLKTEGKISAFNFRFIQRNAWVGIVDHFLYWNVVKLCIKTAVYVRFFNFFLWGEYSRALMMR